ncbi:MAG: MarC family protein [Rhodocyclaceae bacterium]|jgi:MarC family membrane protein|nr:MarC family protein [Rhodocyclaceae bacterium]MCA3025213.1 MarC family protein [Rhodocyclaceae bacterium]MCA3030308.1 MarC family protein [Rhodocyclaceae bacterium]MCA3036106.1 MarC family protein [Rhodocyclaceae bacterium]MCA3045424.1 MarC family protein [Rhodocyclaceae bacterium]
MNADLISAFVLLFLVLDPLGNLPVVASLLKQVDSTRRARVVARECLIAYLILLAFMFGGRQFLDVMHLSEISLSIAGGVILFMIAINMVFKKADGVFGESLDHEPFIVPLAIPLIAGPSALATVMLMVSREPAKLGVWVAAMTAAVVVSATLLILGEKIEKLLGQRAMEAIERLMGLILTAIAVEMLLGGIKQFLLQVK